MKSCSSDVYCLHYSYWSCQHPCDNCRGCFFYVKAHCSCWRCLDIHSGLRSISWRLGNGCPGWHGDIVRHEKRPNCKTAAQKKTHKCHIPKIRLHYDQCSPIGEAVHSDLDRLTPVTVTLRNPAIYGHALRGPPPPPPPSMVYGPGCPPSCGMECGFPLPPVGWLWGFWGFGSSLSF